MKRPIVWFLALTLVLFGIVGWKGVAWEDYLDLKMLRTVTLIVNGSVFSPSTVQESIGVAVSDSLADNGITAEKAEKDTLRADVAIYTPKIFIDGSEINSISTTVGDPGDGNTLVTDGGIRKALKGLSQAAVKADSLIVRKADESYGAVFTYNETTGDLDIEIF